ncbi:glycerophosphodiester phosphodiesterase [Nocardioides sp. CER19]|uniref:glycerophosphodiester phosphodiesterase n=1 Tax=Nocardioides sp. CER19 TaxID=3038538 RepID=UPI002448F2FE|nr:glycerophosphodiester phosphodiesterase [Nocardioides sp. CER19]MDH2415742.1 glycerophosphodiester phosphodiesterase [Nocardioides sp. CER19]
MSRRIPRRVLISAHRGGAGHETTNENTLQAVELAVAEGVDYVELDVQRRADGSLVVLHDDPESGTVTADPVRYDVLLGALGPARAHLDLKFGSRDGGAEIDAVRQALAVLGPGPHVATTGRVRSARALREWADAEGVDLKVGISIGGTVAGKPLREQARQRWAELFAWPKVASSRADVIAAHYALAFFTLRRLARRRGLDLLVWTPDHPLLLRYWLRPGRAWLVTTNHPARALAIRARRGADRMAP